MILLVKATMINTIIITDLVVEMTDLDIASELK